MRLGMSIPRWRLTEINSSARTPKPRSRQRPLGPGSHTGDGCDAGLRSAQPRQAPTNCGHRATVGLMSTVSTFDDLSERTDALTLESRALVATPLPRARGITRL